MLKENQYLGCIISIFIYNLTFSEVTTFLLEIVACPETLSHVRTKNHTIDVYVLLCVISFYSG